MCRACSTYGNKRNAYKILAGMPEGKMPLESYNGSWRNRVGWYELDSSGSG
jgi:hypothetical protein